MCLDKGVVWIQANHLIGSSVALSLYSTLDTLCPPSIFFHENMFVIKSPVKSAALQRKTWFYENSANILRHPEQSERNRYHMHRSSQKM